MCDCAKPSLYSILSVSVLYVLSVGYYLHNPRKFISISFISLFSSSKLKCPSCLFFQIGKVNLLDVWLKSILTWREAVHNCHRCLWAVVCPSLQLYFLETCLAEEQIWEHLSSPSRSIFSLSYESHELHSYMPWWPPKPVRCAHCILLTRVWIPLRLVFLHLWPHHTLRRTYILLQSFETDKMPPV